MYKRLKFLRNSLNLSQSAFASIIGLSQTGYSTIERKQSSITEQTIIAICSKFNVNENWVRTGTGEMFNFSQKKYNEFFELFNNLNEPLQNFLLNVAKDLLDTQKLL